MPGLNKNGPTGAGPMTGWKRGLCRGASAGNASSVDERPGYGSGRAMGPGFRCGSGARWGRGRTSWMEGSDNLEPVILQGFPEIARGMGGNPSTDASLPPMRGIDETERLEADAQSLKNSLEAIYKRIEALENRPSG